jgi:hypothetical protein
MDRFGKGAEDKINESKERTKHWQKEDFARVKQQGEEWGKAFALLIDRGLTSDDPAVQEMVAEHYKSICQFWTPDRQAYIGLGRLYTEHPHFRKHYGAFHPRMASFLAAAIQAYATHKL